MSIRWNTLGKHLITTVPADFLAPTSPGHLQTQWWSSASPGYAIRGSNSRDPASRSSLPTFATTVLTCAGHLRIVPVPVFRVETKNTVFMTYPMHNWAPYWLFTMVYACVPHFNLWRGHKHPCSFQLRIALNLKSTRHYMGIDLVP